MVGNNRFKVGIYIRLSQEDKDKKYESEMMETLNLIVLLAKEVY